MASRKHLLPMKGKKTRSIRNNDLTIIVIINHWEINPDEFTYSSIVTLVRGTDSKYLVDDLHNGASLSYVG